MSNNAFIRTSAESESLASPGGSSSCLQGSLDPLHLSSQLCVLLPAQLELDLQLLDRGAQLDQLLAAGGHLSRQQSLSYYHAAAAEEKIIHTFL